VEWPGEEMARGFTGEYKANIQPYEAGEF
jgi:hypothetical protein